MTALNGTTSPIVRTFGATQSSAFSRRGAVHPSVTFAGENAMIEVHEDNPSYVRNRYQQAGLTGIRFQFIDMPITETLSPRYEQIALQGRSEDYYSYGGTGNRVIPLTLIFCSSVEQQDNGEQHDLALRQALFLESLALPHYGPDGISYPPALCRLILGRFISARGVVTNYERSTEGPFSGDNVAFEYPLVVRCTIDFTEVNRRPRDAMDRFPYPGAELRLQ